MTDCLSVERFYVGMAMFIAAGVVADRLAIFLAAAIRRRR